MKKQFAFLAILSTAMVLASCGPSRSEDSSSGNNVVDSLSEQSELSSISSVESPAVSSIEEDSPEASSSSSSSVSNQGGEEEGANRVLRLAYHHDDNSQNNLAIWIWADGVAGRLYEWDDVLNENFSYIDIHLDEEPYAGFAEDYLWFIIRPKSTWAGQSTDTQVFFSELDWFDTDTGKMAIAYCCQGAGGSVEVYEDEKGALGNKFSTLSISSDLKKITYTATAKPAYINVYVFDHTFYDYNDDVRSAHRHDYLKKTVVSPAQNGSFTLEELGVGEFDIHNTYAITGAFDDNIAKVRTKYLDKTALYDTKYFIANHTYSGHDLGATYNASDKSTSFKVWAPTSAKAEVIVYQSPTPRTLNKGKDYSYNDDNLVARIPLLQQPGGVFSGTYSDKDLKGRGYVYRLYRDDGYVDAVDPYAKASGANSRRGAIVDFSETNPDGFETSLGKLKNVNGLNELTIYEVHVRDLTSHETWNGKEDRGTYKAFVETGTSYKGMATGFDHIKDLGVDSLQLLPVFDQDNDERTYDRTLYGVTEHIAPAYNWGYNPQLYCVPEGSYASDPYTPNVRINEFKSLIQNCADNGMRIIMDVVYNHVSSVTTNPFTAVVPGYYFQYDGQGFLIDHTGCGNTTNSSRVMFKNFMVDSLSFWAKEYGIKGFRFDLMGAIDYAAMRAVKDALYAIDPNIVVYGEPWSTVGTMVTEVYSQLGDNGKGSIGAFNNGGRNGLKGDTASGDVVPSYGFMNTGIDYMNANLKKEADAAFMGWNSFGWDYGTQNPAQTVNYVSCHDNYTLFDQFNYTLRGDTGLSDKHDDAIAQSAKEAATATIAATMFGEGAAFIQGGDEFFRYKVMEKDDELYDEMVESYKHGSYDHGNGRVDYWIEGDGIELTSGRWLVRNSYKYGDAVNGFDYNLLFDNARLYAKVKEAVAFRNANMGNIFGKTRAELNAGNATMWGDVVSEVNPTDPIIAAYMHGKNDNATYYLVLSGRETANGEYNNIGVGSCKIHIDYSSNDFHDLNDEFNCTTTLGAGKFEMMVCHVVG